MTDPFGFDELELAWLRSKPGIKWQRTPGALAAWVADMDFPPAPVVAERLAHVLAVGDTVMAFGSGSPAPGPRARGRRSRLPELAWVRLRHAGP